MSRLGLGSRGLLLGGLLRGLGLVGRRGAGLLLEVRRPADVAVDALEADHVLLALVGAEVQLRAVLLDVELARAGLDVVAAEAAGALVDHSISPHPELLGLARRLAEHEDVAHLDGAHRVPRDDAALVAAVEHADLDLRGLARHARAADDLDHFGGDARFGVFFRHLTSPAYLRRAATASAISPMICWPRPASTMATLAVGTSRPAAVPSSCLEGTYV